MSTGLNLFTHISIWEFKEVIILKELLLEYINIDMLRMIYHNNGLLKLLESETNIILEIETVIWF